MDKSLYFYIYYPRTQRETESDINFIVPENKSECPECIYNKEIYEEKDNKNITIIRRYTRLLNQTKQEKMQISIILNFK